MKGLWEEGGRTREKRGRRERGRKGGGYLEPVNGAAVDKGGEHSKAGAEGVPNGAHGQHHMKLIPHTVDKHAEQSQGSAICLL